MDFFTGKQIVLISCDLDEEAFRSTTVSVQLPVQRVAMLDVSHQRSPRLRRVFTGDENCSSRWRSPTGRISLSLSSTIASCHSLSDTVGVQINEMAFSDTRVYLLSMSTVQFAMYIYRQT